MNEQHKINSWKDEYSGTLRRGLVGNYISLDKTIINRQKMHTTSKDACKEFRNTKHQQLTCCFGTLYMNPDQDSHPPALRAPARHRRETHGASHL